jgi:WD40 repeat protein
MMLDVSTKSVTSVDFAEAGVAELALAPDGTWAAVAASDETVQIWELPHWTRRLTLSHRFSKLPVCSTSSDGALLVTADTRTYLWDALTGAEKARIPDTHAYSRIIAYESGRVIGLRPGESAWVWGIGSPRDRRAPADYPGGAKAMISAPDGTWLATLTGDGTVRIWDPARRPGTASERAGYRKPIRTVLSGKGGLWLAVVDADDEWQILNADTGRARRRRSPAVQGRPLASAGSDAPRLVILVKTSICIWDPMGNEPPRPLPDSSVDLGSSAPISTAGKWLAVAAKEEVIIWNVDSAELEGSWFAHRTPYETVKALAIPPGGEWLATLSTDGKMRLWDVRSRSKQKQFSFDSSPNTIMIAYDAGLAIADRTGTIRFRDLDRLNRPGVSVDAHSGRVTAMALNLGGTLLASVGEDRAIRIWDVDTRRPVATMRVEAAINSCAWGPDGAYLTVAGTAGLYQFALDKAVTRRP